MSGCHEKISRDNQPSTQTLVVAMLYRAWHEPMLASMGMPKAILYYTCII